MVSSWRHLISDLPKWKIHPSLVMTKHIRERSRKPSTPQTRDGARTLTLLPLILKYKTAVYFPLPHKWSIIVCSERPSGKNRITKGPVHRFVSQISLLDPTWCKSPPEVIEIIKTSINQFSKILYILTISKSKINLALKMTMRSKSFRKLRPEVPFENTL